MAACSRLLAEPRTFVLQVDAGSDVLEGTRLFSLVDISGRSKKDKRMFARTVAKKKILEKIGPKGSLRIAKEDPMDKGERDC